MSAPLVLLHGFAGDTADWSLVVGNLGEGIAEPIYGHRGHPEAEETTFDREVDRLAAFVERHGLRGAQLAGYSLGGRLALGLLARHPGLFSGATLIGVQPGLSSPALRAERLQADAQWATLLESSGLGPFFAAWTSQPLFESQRRFPEQVAARVTRLLGHHHPQGLTQALRALGLGAMPDLWPALAAIRQPLRLVHGALDPKFGALAREMAGLLPFAEICEIAHCGHNPLLEQPQALAQLLHAPPELHRRRTYDAQDRIA